MSSEEQHYPWHECRLTARGIVLTCDVHDDQAAKNLVVQESHRQRLPCWTAKKVWYGDEEIRVSIRRTFSKNEAYPSRSLAFLEAGEAALDAYLANEQAPLSNEAFWAFLPFDSCAKLIPHLNAQQALYLASRGTAVTRRQLANHQILPLEAQSIMAEDEDADVRFGIAHRQDLLPELQMGLAKDIWSIIYTEIGLRLDVLPEVKEWLDERKPAMDSQNLSSLLY